MLLEPVVLRYLEQYPDVTLDLEVSARTVDLVREGFDLAIRAGALPDSSLSVRKLGQARTGYFACRGYVKKHGAPAEPRSLAEHSIVAVGTKSAVEWPFARDGKALSVPIRPRLLTSSNELATRAVAAGLGIARIPETPVHLLTPPGLQPAKMRAFVKRVLEELGRGSALSESKPSKDSA